MVSSNECATLSLYKFSIQDMSIVLHVFNKRQKISSEKTNCHQFDRLVKCPNNSTIYKSEMVCYIFPWRLMMLIK